VSLNVYALEPGATTYTEVGTWGAGGLARLAQPFAVEVALDRLAVRTRG
jgi:hypothetical protein